MKGEASPPAELVEAMARAIASQDASDPETKINLARVALDALSQAGWVVVPRRKVEKIGRLLDAAKGPDGFSFGASPLVDDAKAHLKAMLSAGEG